MSRPAGLALRVQDGGAGAVCAEVLAALPHWFGFPDSVADYVESADTQSDRGGDRGRARLRDPDAAPPHPLRGRDRRHGRPARAPPRRHRAGPARGAETWLAERDITYLQVKTLSPRSADEGYAATRAFYFGCGFRPLEEMPELWGRTSRRCR